jgi:hypothetical protein
MAEEQMALSSFGPLLFVCFSGADKTSGLESIILFQGYKPVRGLQTK